jgi:hypothetical protein
MDYLPTGHCRIQLELPTELYEEVRLRAEVANLTFNELVERLLNSYLGILDE